ncbi:MerR family DNA-binding transcriptional regulator [Microbacterium paulum]
MLKIGEFAGLTGLSVKALRHYDETGALVPADVDDRSAYRLYTEGQVRAGVTIRALRDAGVPLPAVSAAIAGGEAEEALETHRVRVLEQREREDRAFREAAGVLRALAASVAVGERSMPAQHFVGQVITVPVDDPESVSDEDANEVFGVLFARLQGAGLGPTGPFWTALRAGDRGTIEMLCCWPTPSDVPEDVRGSETFSGVLPARLELVATWRPALGEELPEGALHPAVVGLFDAIAERGATLGDVEVRQAVVGQSADDYVVELSVTVS